MTDVPGSNDPIRRSDDPKTRSGLNPWIIMAVPLIVCGVVLGCILWSAGIASLPKKGIARAKVRNLDGAVQTYKEGVGAFPPNLEALFQRGSGGRDPILRDRNDLIDPWGQPIQYDPAGPHNKGECPDIWTVSPGLFGERIGNW